MNCSRNNSFATQDYFEMGLMTVARMTPVFSARPAVTHLLNYGLISQQVLLISAVGANVGLIKRWLHFVENA